MFASRLVLLTAALSVGRIMHAQIPGAAAPADPARWSISVREADPGTWDVVFRVDIEPGWYVYSQQSFGNDGPMPTRIAFDTLAHATLIGNAAETGEHVVQGRDPVFDMEVKKFKGWALFTQRIGTGDPQQAITGRLEYMACDDQRCIFPEPQYFRIVPAGNAGELGPLPFKADDAAMDQAAPVEPVTWTMAIEQKGDGRWVLKFNATVQDGWYIYSQESFGADGPIPTSIALDSALTHTRLVGEPMEEGPEKVEGFDEIFAMNVRKYKHAATFSREVQVEDPSRDITGAVSYMTCNDEACIFPDPVRFTVNIASGVATIGGEPIAQLPPGTPSCKYKLPNVDLEDPVIRATDEALSVTRGGKSLGTIFLLGFIGGLLALLTPCVFPMIPLTVSFFTKGGDDKAKGLRNAVTYGGFILVIYLLFSLPFHLLGSVNPEIFNEISTNPWLNVFFFAIFIVFAISFFGYFEITLPAGWVNSMDQKASQFGGLIGIFFMALTLALVSFSCTGPILGSLLAGALTADGGAWQLTMGMGGFGLALALPFALFAMFPRWLSALPRSGSWLNSVKVVLGFAEVALAFKFLSNADLVKHWGILPYEVFMAIWVLCGLGIVIYLLGKIKFPHDGPVRHFSPLRLAFTSLFGLATVYMLMGFRYNDEEKTFTVLKLMSGLAPPVGYSWIFPKECPANLDCHHDLDLALEQARKLNKPVLVDFTGYACVNCRKMEEHVWPEKGVHEVIDRKYVLVSLYVDDKAELPGEEQHDYVTCAGKPKRIETRGNKWSTVQSETFVNNSQPFYVLLSPDGRLLTDPVAYTPDVDEYAAFLRRGLEGMRVLDQRAGR